jgi:predicted ATPase with chaperone activity
MPLPPAPTTTVSVPTFSASGAPLVLHITVSTGVLPGFGIFGLVDSHDTRTVRDRLRCALINGGFDWPQARVAITVPGDPIDWDAGWDLAASRALLVATGQMAHEDIAEPLWGELGLDGSVRPRPIIFAGPTHLTPATR